MNPNDIVYESPRQRAYVTVRAPGHYEVYRNAGTHAERVATYHFPHDPARAHRRATARADEIDAA